MGGKVLTFPDDKIYNQGKKEGEAKGEAKGELKGALLEKERIAIRMIESNFQYPIEEISRVSELPISRVKELIENDRLTTGYQYRFGGSTYQE